jgi:hypothetical protein
MMGDMDGDGDMGPPPGDPMGPPPEGMEGMDEMHSHMDDAASHGPAEGDMPPPPEGDMPMDADMPPPPPEDNPGDDVV